ncbi:MAG TPA: COX15/CtaA family protein [Tepidisphaeraceae bacterium]
MNDRDPSNPNLDYSQSPALVPGGGALHFVAVLTALATFPLIFMGGLVTSHQAGMSVPDWPNSYGYNMFLFPPRLWIGGILYEHTHRLMATVVGLLSIALVIASFQSRWAGRRERWLAASVLGVVILQGVLGGLRVVLVKLDLAIVHACLAQAFFCLASFAAIETSRWWQTRPAAPPAEQTRARSLVILGVVSVFAIYAQLVVGAMMRHFQAGLAIPDLPLAYGKILPPMNPAQLDAVNWARVRDLNLEPVTLGQIWLHFGHRIGAVLVTALVLALATTVLRRYATEPKLRRPAILLIGLILVQVSLGVLTVLMRKPADVASAHVAVGALVLATAFVLTARAIRLYGLFPRNRQARAAAMNHSGLLMPQ